MQTKILFKIVTLILAIFLVTACSKETKKTRLLAEAARPCRHAVGDRWFVDETYVKDRSAKVVIAGHGFVQNLRRGHYELAVEEPAPRRVAVAFDELALAT